MSAPLDEEYFTWLYSQVASTRLKTPTRTYWTLFRQLYTKEFVWLVPNDDNRVEDGRDLRYEFLDLKHIEEPDPSWMHLGCSMLEMLIALSRRLSFEAESPAHNWFWHLIDNLELRKYNDKFYNGEDISKFMLIHDILNRVIYRTYAYNGSGGLFPLEHAMEDQTQVEIWYQLSAYVSARSH